ncbi:MAG TPA: queuosine precursor transporter [Phycisphaerae bacterium]|nr:queuosine precursor transporter [Phycisphaerales bacterium]HRX83758.1 queuosine precursor transporter [Phycisphaerae bacterium]
MLSAVTFVPTPPNDALFLLHLLAAGGILLLFARLGRTWLVALIVVCTLLMNIAVAKSVTIFGMSVTGGNVLFATVFLANDVLNEHFGRRAARQAVLIGFATGLVVVVMMQFVLRYEPNAFDTAQAALVQLFDVRAYPRVVAASMVSYLLAQLLDVQIYQWIRSRTGAGRMLWLRSNASTWLAQAYDTVFFTTVGITALPVAWLDAGPIATWSTWWQAVVFAYLLKIALAAVDTGFLYLTTWRWLTPKDSQRTR